MTYDILKQIADGSFALVGTADFDTDDSAQAYINALAQSLSTQVVASYQSGVASVTNLTSQ